MTSALKNDVPVQTEDETQLDAAKTEDLAVNDANTTEKADQQTSVPKRAQRKREREVFSNPSIAREITINTQQAQRIAKRSLEYATYSLFSLDVILPIIGDRTEIGDVDKIISDAMKAVMVEFDKKLKQLQKVMEVADIKSLSKYSNPVVRKIEVESPQVAQFVRIIEKLDTLVQHIDTLWLNGEIPSFDRSDEIHILQRRASRLATKIVEIESRARKSAHEKGRGAEVELVAPKKAGEMQPDEEDDGSDDE